MRLLLREDLGGTLARLKHLTGLADIKISKPLVFFKGPNGCGKSAILEGMLTATHRFGVHFGNVVRSTVELGEPLTTAWRQEGWDKVDLAKHALLRNSSRWPEPTEIQIDDRAPGAFDTRALQWRGQETFYFTARHEYGSDRFDLPRRRQMNEDNMRSHGEKMAGELNYALAWGLGLIDTPEPEKRHEGGDIATAKKNIAAYLKGAPQTTISRERRRQRSDGSFWTSLKPAWMRPGWQTFSLCWQRIVRPAISGPSAQPILL